MFYDCKGWPYGHSCKDRRVPLADYCSVCINAYAEFGGSRRSLNNTDTYTERVIDRVRRVLSQLIAH